MSRKECRKQYFNNKLSTLALLDVVQGKVDTGATTIELFFPYPFQLLGFADITVWPSSPPLSELPMNEFYSIKSAADNNTNSGMLQDIFSVMMYANRDKGNYSASPFFGGIQYFEKAWAEYNNYFSNYLNTDLKPFFYNQFLSNLSLIKKFWADQVTIGLPQTDQPNLLFLSEKMFNISDRRLWGAPGLYIINYSQLDLFTGDEQLFPSSSVDVHS